MVRIIRDLDALYDGGDVVESVAGYVRAYAVLQRAVNSSQTVELVVRDRSCARWLERAAAKYGAQKAQVVNHDARVATAQAWGVAIPASYTDADIAHDRLWEYAPSVFPDDGFENVLLRTFYGEVFLSAHLAVSGLGLVAEAYDLERWRQNEQMRCVATAYKRRMDQWQRNAHPGAQARLAKLIATDIGAARLLLQQFLLLQSYPEEVARRVIGERFDDLKQLQPGLAGLSVEEDARASVIPHVAVYLDEAGAMVATIADIDGFLGRMSGLLDIELNQTRTVLERLAPQLDEKTVSKVQERFAALLPERRPDVDRLRDLVGPPFPSAPEGFTSEQDWVRWAVDEYLPYRFWSDRTGQSSDALADLGCAFQDWLYSSYQSIRSSSRLALHNALHRVRDAVSGPEKWLLVIVADNLGVRYLPLLLRALNRRGFAKTFCEYAIAALPTETGVAKKCLLGDSGSQAAVAAVEYADLVKRWQGVFWDRPVHYAADLSKLDSVEAGAPSTIFLNYLVLDEALHKDDAPSGRTHEETIGYYCDGLAGAVRKWADSRGIAHDLEIAVVADHGSVFLDGSEANPVDTSFLKDYAEDRHHRFVRLSDAELSEFPESLQQQCYMFARHQHELADTYAVARANFTFSKGAGRGFAHGGLSAEEVIVPVAVLRLALSQMEMPRLSLVSKVFRHENPEDIKFELTNPSPYELEDVVCELRAEGLVTQTAFLPAVRASEVAAFSVQGKFRKTGQPVDRLMVACSFQLGGQRHDLDESSFPIELKSLVERKERRFM